MLDYEDYADFCELLFNRGQNCTLYISLSTNSDIPNSIVFLMEVFNNKTTIQNLTFPAIGLLEGMMLEFSLEEIEVRHFFFDAKDINQTYVFDIISNDGIIDFNTTIFN